MSMCIYETFDGQYLQIIQTDPTTYALVDDVKLATITNASNPLLDCEYTKLKQVFISNDSVPDLKCKTVNVNHQEEFPLKMYDTDDKGVINEWEFVALHPNTERPSAIYSMDGQLKTLSQWAINVQAPGWFNTCPIKLSALYLKKLEDDYMTVKGYHENFIISHKRRNS